MQKEKRKRRKKTGIFISAEVADQWLSEIFFSLLNFLRTGILRKMLEKENIG